MWAKKFPVAGVPLRRFTGLEPNDLSVALLLRTPGVHLLLGADLERGRSDYHGWRAVVRSPLRPQVRSATYKVAHHGSPGADMDGIWDHLTQPAPFAVVTPWSAGANVLPTMADVKRIKTRTGKLYCTTWPPKERPPKRRGVDQTINQVTGGKRWAIPTVTGQVQLRVPIDGISSDFKVEVGGKAKLL